MTLRALVVGLGQIGMGFDLALDPGTFVLTHARAFQQHPRFHLVGGVDDAPERRTLFETEYGCAAYSRLDDALRESQPDVIAIATPTTLHGPMFRQILAAAPSAAVLCEKPLSYDLDEARLMVGDFAGQNGSLFVNYIRRSDPGAIEIRRRLDDGRIATPVRGVAWYSKGLFHNGSHYVNLLQYWLGDILATHVIAKGRLWGGIDPEPDVQVTFECGTMTFLAAREEDFSHYTLELVAPNGRLRVDESAERMVWQPAIRNPVAAGYTVLSPSEEQIETGMSRYQWNVVDQLVAALDGTAAHICTGVEALATLESLETIRAKL